MLPYGNFVRTLQVDMVAFDNADSSIRAYEIKRGNGQFDAGKIRSITRDLKCIQLLKSYGEICKYKPAAAELKIIFYYGVRSIPRPWSLVKNELDEHFGFPVVKKIEQAMTTSETSCMPFLTRRKFGAIYADPPWHFRNWRNALSHYDCPDFKTLAALPVAEAAPVIALCSSGQ